ncbi:AEC family transporter [Salipiger sp. PrR002]|uniref:AEC family transporter n=1 Tax=Salipiger sp. PrR002 TaxID=2706489 RepID=UPI0013B7B7DA|nr:AEC family transporter [Salipiger sp. PrR002]NDW00588.1 malonate transporter [Salipiger sp. PrR002]NDW57583.1 malonate transporter [Salipiger sp. PrR004]
MLTVLTHDILPVFALLALGFALGRRQIFTRQDAASANRIALMVLQPGLIFPLIATVPFADFDLRALLTYGACEAAAFAACYALARRLFRCAALEAWLLAMTVIFVNSLLYIRPISLLIYGESGALPVTAVVAWDTAIAFAFFIISSDLIARPSAGPLPALKRLSVNPTLISIVLGIAVNLSGLPLPEPIRTACDFAGAGTAPLVLFALGLLLSGQSLKPSPVVVSFAALKLFGFPLLVTLALWLMGVAGQWQAQFTLLAAGPSGAMAFALALLHGTRTDRIAAVTIWTSALSLLSLAALA